MFCLGRKWTDSQEVASNLEVAAFKQLKLLIGHIWKSFNNSLKRDQSRLNSKLLP